MAQSFQNGIQVTDARGTIQQVRACPRSARIRLNGPRKINQRYGQIIAGPLAATAMIVVRGAWEKLIEKLLGGLLLIEFSDNLLNVHKKESQSTERSDNPSTKNIESIPNDRPLGGNKFGEGRYS